MPDTYIDNDGYVWERTTKGRYFCAVLSTTLDETRLERYRGPLRAVND
jgi:hypothetical protein